MILADAGQTPFLEGNVSGGLVGLFSINRDFLKYCIHELLISIFRAVVNILEAQAWSGIPLPCIILVQGTLLFLSIHILAQLEFTMLVLPHVVVHSFNPSAWKTGR